MPKHKRAEWEGKVDAADADAHRHRYGRHDDARANGRDDGGPQSLGPSGSPSPQWSRTRLLRLMDAYPELVAEMAKEFEQRVSQRSSHSVSVLPPAGPLRARPRSAESASAVAPAPMSTSPLSARLPSLRDQALADGVIALVMSFLPAPQRSAAGRACRRWLAALGQPSLWRRCGWHCPDERWQQRIDLPPLARRHIGVLRCGADWLLRKSLLAQVSDLPQLRRLELLPYQFSAPVDVSADALRRALQPLHLESLTLPRLDGSQCRPLEEALADGPTGAASTAGAEPSSSRPLLACWSAHLAELRLSLPVAAISPLLRTLGSLQWPLLRCLAVCLNEEHLGDAGGGGTAEVAQLLQRAVSPQRMPALKTLRCDHELDGEGDSASNREAAAVFLMQVWLPTLPRLTSLTSLTLSQALFAQQLPSLSLFRAIGAHNLPQLGTLELEGILASSRSREEGAEVKRILQRMDSLTRLSISTHFSGGDSDWMHSLHLLPSLHRLSLCEAQEARFRPSSDVVDAYLQSISAAPRLHSVRLTSPVLGARLAQLWWRRMGQPRLQTDALDGEQWEQVQLWLQQFDSSSSSDAAGGAAPGVSSASPSAPSIPIRSLHLPLPRWSESAFFGSCCVYLAHLPCLRTLALALLPEDLAHLSLLRRLRSLSIRLVDGEKRSGPEWTNECIRIIADTRLPQLHTLRLEGDGEDPGQASEGEAADPNFDWDEPTPDPEFDPIRAQYVDVSVGDGLRRLLQLPALTRLAVPYVPRDTVDYMRACAVAAGRHSLHVERARPPSRRGDFDKRWIEEQERSRELGLKDD